MATKAIPAMPSAAELCTAVSTVNVSIDDPNASGQPMLLYAQPILRVGDTRCTFSRVSLVVKSVFIIPAEPTSAHRHRKRRELFNSFFYIGTQRVLTRVSTHSSARDCETHRAYRLACCCQCRLCYAFVVPDTFFVRASSTTTCSRVSAVAQEGLSQRDQLLFGRGSR